jgi:hypothetical protein
MTLGLRESNFCSFSCGATSGLLGIVSATFSPLINTTLLNAFPHFQSVAISAKDIEEKRTNTVTKKIFFTVIFIVYKILRFKKY